MNREVIEPGVSGVFAATEDEWVSELRRLVDDPGMRSRMGAAARSVVEKSYSLDQIGSKMTDLVESLLD